MARSIDDNPQLRATDVFNKMSDADANQKLAEVRGSLRGVPTTTPLEERLMAARTRNTERNLAAASRDKKRDDRAAGNAPMSDVRGTGVTSELSSKRGPNDPASFTPPNAPPLEASSVGGRAVRSTAVPPRVKTGLTDALERADTQQRVLAAVGKDSSSRASVIRTPKDSPLVTNAFADADEASTDNTGAH